MTDFLYNDFASRLNFLCQSRKLYGWLLSTGLNSSNINTIKTNNSPNAELLAILRVQENVNANWVLDGSENPYRIYKAVSDAEARDYLDALLSDEPGEWTLYLMEAKDRRAIVLTMPAAMDVKGKEIAYTLVEIIGGNLGAETLERAAGEGARGVLRLEMLPADMDRLATGWMSNKELLGWRDQPGLLAKAEPMKKPLKVADDHQAPYAADSRKAKLASLIELLTEDQADAFSTLLRSLKPRP